MPAMNVPRETPELIESTAVNRSGGPPTTVLHRPGSTESHRTATKLSILLERFPPFLKRCLFKRASMSVPRGSRTVAGHRRNIVIANFVINVAIADKCKRLRSLVSNHFRESQSPISTISSSRAGACSASRSAAPGTAESAARATASVRIRQKREGCPTGFRKHCGTR